MKITSKLRFTKTENQTSMTYMWQGKGPSIKDVRSKGGESIFLAIKNYFFGVSLESNPPPPPPWIAIYFGSDRNIFCVSDVFTLDTVRTSEMGRGVCLPNGRCRTGREGQKVSFWSDVFDGWPLMSNGLPMSSSVDITFKVTAHKYIEYIFYIQIAMKYWK